MSGCEVIAGIPATQACCYTYSVTQSEAYMSTLSNRVQGWGAGPGLQCRTCSLTIQATSPIFAQGAHNASSTILGQFVVGIGVKQLSEFLQEMKIGKSGAAFVVEFKADGAQLYNDC